MILHIMMDEKFTVPFVSFFNEHFDNDQHCFLVMSSSKKMRFAEAVTCFSNVVVVHKNIPGLYHIVSRMLKAKKIILHGMFIPYIVYLVKLLRLAPKTYWCIWGGDLYDYKLDRPQWKKVKTSVISKLGGIITPLEGDYQLAQQAYGAKAPCYYCLGPNTVIRQETLRKSLCSTHACVSILVGNSADLENNHYFLLDQLKCYAKENIHLYLPLSYGDQEYADRVSAYAAELFGDKATAMREFMPLDQYQSFLHSIDVAVFAHKRQQAFSNIIQLAANGVKLYLEPDGSIWRFLQSHNVRVFDVHTLNQNLFPLLDEENAAVNRENICAQCSMENLLQEWKTVFEV